MLLDDDEPIPAGDLIEHVGGSQASVYRELKRLAQAGLIERAQPGRSASYRAAKESPLYRPLRELLERTLGVEPLLRRSLAKVEGIEVAAIFGSWAEGDASDSSDIDLLVIGDMNRNDLLAAVRSVESRAGREIDVTAYGRAEFDRRLDEGSGFLRTILRGPLIPLIGDPR